MRKSLHNYKFVLYVINSKENMNLQKVNFLVLSLLKFISEAKLQLHIIEYTLYIAKMHNFMNICDVQGTDIS